MRDGPYFKWNIITQNRISEILPLLAHLSNANSKSPLTTYRRETVLPTSFGQDNTKRLMRNDIVQCSLPNYFMAANVVDLQLIKTCSDMHLT